MNPAGYLWLIEHYALKACPLAHSSLIGPKMVRRERADGTVKRRKSEFAELTDPEVFDIEEAFCKHFEDTP